MSTYLVTGGAGFIGSNLVDELIEKGNNVIVLDNFDDYYEKSQKMKNLNPKAKLYEGTITDADFLKKIFEENKIDGVFHLAAKAGVRDSILKPAEYFNTNVTGTVNVLKMCVDYKVKKIVLASSSSVYGEVEYIPTDENHKMNPISPYAHTKLINEQLCEYYMRNHNLPAVWARFYTVYGKRGRPDMVIAKFTKAILSGEQLEIYGDGEQLRDFTNVKDIVQGLTLSMEKEFTGPLNLGTGQKVSVNFLVKHIEELTGKKANVIHTEKKEGDVSKTMADISKAKNELGYSPKYTIEAGLKEYVEWYKKENNL